MSSANILPRGSVRPRALAAAAFAALVCAPAFAQTLQVYDIPPGEAGAALQAFARQSDIQLLYAPDKVAGEVSSGFQGAASAQQALDAILADTDLAFVFLSEDLAAIERRQTDPPPLQPLELKSDSPSSTARQRGMAPRVEAPIVVTGRRGAATRDRLAVSYALSVIDLDAPQTASGRTPAAALDLVPGFWVESSGGEASNNARPRGVPGDGFSTVGMLEDGLPIQHDPGLSFLNADQSFRLDAATSRIEVVRGGPASIFTSKAPGGVVNFIAREPGDGWSGLAQAETGDFGLIRLDGWAGFGTGSWRISAGGFYRRDDGVRSTGYTANEGGQFRARVTRELGGAGAVTLAYRRLDDSVAFYLPIPLTYDEQGRVTAIDGFNPNFGTLNGPDLSALTLPLGESDRLEFDLDSGTRVRLDQWTLEARFDAGGWRVAPRIRHRRSDTRRDGLFPGTPGLAGDRAAQALAETAGGVSGVWLVPLSGSERPLPDEALVIDAAASVVRAPLDELLADISATRRVDRHDLAVGIYAARTDTALRRDAARVLLEAREQARLLNLIGVGQDGSTLALSQDGILQAGAQYDRGHGRETALAVYASDEWTLRQGTRIDAGFRYEQSRIDGAVEETQVADAGEPSAPWQAESITGTGRWQPFTSQSSRLGWTVGLDQALSDRSGVFVRYTDTHRLPGLGDFWSRTPSPRPVVEEITIAELGYKHVGPRLSLFATGFHSAFSGFRLRETVFDADGGLSERSVYADTRTLGVEFEAAIDLGAGLDVSLHATLQQPRFRNFSYDTVENGEPVSREIGGNRLLRVPDVSARLAPGWTDPSGRLRLEASLVHHSARHADAANTLRLPPYTVAGAVARLDLSDRAWLQLSADNLTNTVGLTEGNPRAGQVENIEAGAEFFTARPILGRSVRASLRYAF
ncbi:hypothetical protein FKB34_14505 [Glycocaulis profundi]|nr:hypothetical protein FKB34_14505 [Glycocaulis profundi]